LCLDLGDGSLLSTLLGFCTVYFIDVLMLTIKRSYKKYLKKRQS